MAPSQSPLTTIGRKRARPTTPRGRSLLRDDVLQLIQTTRAPVVAQQQRLESIYGAAWRAFCQTTHHETRHDNGVSIAHFTTAWGELHQIVRTDGVPNDLLVQKIAYAVCASRSRNRHPRLLLEWIWRGHMDGNGSLWRLEDVMVRIASIAGENALSEWLRASVCSLVSTGDETVTSRMPGRAVIAYLVRIAFTSSDSHTTSTADAGSLDDTTGVSLTEDAASLARHALAHLCTPRQVITPPTVLALVSDLVAHCMADHKSDAAITAALQAFLRAQVKRLLIRVASSQDIEVLHHHDAIVGHILATFQSCVTAANAVQLFRQVWTEVSSQSPHSIARLDAVESLGALLAVCAARDGSFKSHALATAHDLAHDAITASNALLLRQSLVLAAAVTTTTTTTATATENADGSATTTDDDAAAYHEWFRGHFASADTPIALAHSASSDRSRLSISSSPLPMSSWGCLRAPPMTTTPSSSSGDGCGTGTGNVAVCGLISTKRHLQFVCAFLLEFDRVGFVGRKAHHVLAHLSAIKTHQTLSGSAVAGLLSDFCSQTRAHFAALQATEQHNRARLRRRSSSSASSLKASSADAISNTSQVALSVPSSPYTSATRSIVEELLELHAKDVAGLVSQVNQWKLFKKQQWRQQILPCCLDFVYWQSVGQFHGGASGGDVQDKKRITELVSFVQVLAKHHAVGTQEYGVFIDQVEMWFKTQQLAADKQSVLLSNRQVKPHPHQPIETSVAMLSEAVVSYFSQASSASPSGVCRDQAWARVADVFVVAFEGLVGLRPSEQDAHMLAIWELIVGRCSAQVTAQAGGMLSLDACVEQHLALWFTLLSRDTAGGASAEERHQVMETYCRVAVQRANEKKTPVASQMEALVMIALTGSLVGLLASLTMCESIAVASSHAMSAQLLPSTSTMSENSVDIAELKRASAFLSGFLEGFLKNATDNAPQIILQSVLPAPLRECLVWLGHFTRTWWASDLSEQQHSHPTRSFWRFVARTNQAVYDQHAWFRLTFSPGVLTGKAQWRVFFERELSCCALELLATADAPLVDLVSFVDVQREQIDHLLFSSSAGLEARVHVADICTWISKVVLDLAHTLSVSTPSPRGHSAAASALDALVWLLKETATMPPQAPRQQRSTRAEQDPLGFILETVTRSASSCSTSARRVSHVNYGLRCAQVILDATMGSRVAPHVIKAFVDRVAHAIAEMPATSVPFEWIRSLWTLITRVPQSADVFPSATHVPSSIFAHWAFEFARLCRVLQPKKNGKSPTCGAQLPLLKAVQTCYEFYRTLGVRRLAAPTSSLSVVGLSASQYVPASAIEESLPLHVRSLEWLLACELLPTPTLTMPDMATLTMPDLKTSLAFHETATRVLAALLEDLALDRPDEVTMELTETCQAAWMSSISTETGGHGVHNQSSFKYQVVLVHMVSELAARHASVGRFLLRSSSELLENPQRGFFVFLVLFASSETEQIDSILAHNGSLWVNTFAEVACAVADVSKNTSSSNRRTVAILQSSSGFQNQLVGVVARVLSFAASRQIDLLDSTVLGRMETLFPSVRDLLGRVPVLNLASAAFSLGDF